MIYVPPQKAATSRFLELSAFAVVIGLTIAFSGYGMSPEEHASHHPGMDTEKVDGKPGMPPDAMGSGKGMGGGMMDGMGKMMEGMGKAPTKELYPTLMSIPELTAEEREKVRGQAYERMHSGIALMSTGLGHLGAAVENQDYAVMQKATADVREALARFESGLAARRALAEGTPPKQAALQWFKSEMNLLSPQGVEVHTGFFGLSLFHLIIMATLILFALVMMWMYFHKMRRATLLLQSLTGGVPPAADGKAVTPAAAVAATVKSAAPAVAPAADAKPAAPAVPPAAPAKPTVPAAPPAAAAKAAAPVAPPAAETKAVAPAVSPATDAKVAPPAIAGKWSGKLRLSQIFDETPNVKTFRLADPLGGEIPFLFQPGQYLTVTVLPEGKPVKRSYTIASSPTERAYVDLTIKREEKGVESRYLHDRTQVGDLLDFAGPSGSFVFTGKECRCLVFIAAGVGITPLMCVTRYLTDKSWPGEIFLLYGCRSPQDYIFKEELEFLQSRHPNVHVVVTVSKPEGTEWKGAVGRISKDLIAQSVPGIASRRVHICGPKEMMDATEKFLAELGVPKEQVKTEAFGPAIGKPEPEAKSADSKAETPKDSSAVAPPASPPAPPVAAAPVAAPAAPPAAATAQPAAGAAVTATFSKSGKTAPLTPEKSILEASEDIGVNIPFECRVGTCGVCKTKLVSGDVTQAVQDALTPEDKAGGIILACQAKSTGNVVVEA